MKRIHTNYYDENIETNDIRGSEEIDVVYEDIKEEKVIDNLNKAGLVELGKRVQAMTDDEKKVVSENIPIEFCFGRIRTEIENLKIADKTIWDRLLMYTGSDSSVSDDYEKFIKELVNIQAFMTSRRDDLESLKQSLSDILVK